MLIAGFAPYMTYKAISFMGFDMYHAMSAEQEAKSALNRPMPIPMSRRLGTEPSKVLDGGASAEEVAAGVTGAACSPPSGPGAGPVGAAGAGGASSGGGGAAGGAAGGVAAGRRRRPSWSPRQAAGAGARTGRSVGGAAVAADRCREPGTTAVRCPDACADTRARGRRGCRRPRRRKA